MVSDNGVTHDEAQCLAGAAPPSHLTAPAPPVEADRVQLLTPVVAAAPTHRTRLLAAVGAAGDRRRGGRRDRNSRRRQLDPRQSDADGKRYVAAIVASADGQTFSPQRRSASPKSVDVIGVETFQKGA